METRLQRICDVKEYQRMVALAAHLMSKSAGQLGTALYLEILAEKLRSGEGLTLEFITTDETKEVADL